MVSIKYMLAILPIALQATALPSLFTREAEAEAAMVCIPPSNCSPIGACEFCCAAGVTPDSPNCHSHGDASCPSGQRQFHCDDEH